MRIVLSTGLIVMQHAVRFVERLHSFFAAAAIRVTLMREAFVQTLDLAPRCIPRSP
jgi:hypothetical protein